MTQESELLYIPQMAARMGRTEAAIRAGVQRNAKWLPPSFKSGAKIAWRKSTADQFFADQEKKGRA